ncbi:MAG TPA: PEGA domain-containing protein [Polyangiaceae bacterium]|nr:PEGA domain-containing protein [Polyangiaceae bacterium]
MFQLWRVPARGFRIIAGLALVSSFPRPALAESRSPVPDRAEMPSSEAAPPSHARFQLESPEASASQTTGEASSNSRADGLFRAGREAFRRGYYAEACAKFAESDLLEPSPGAKLNRGLCEEQLGHFALSWRLLQESASALPPEDERVSIALQHVQALRGKLAFLTVTLASSVPSTAQITADGAELGRAELGLPLAYDPGTHVLELSAPGFRSRRTELSLGPGANRRVNLTLGAAVHEPSGVPLRASTTQHPWRTTSFALGGAAVTLLIVGATSGVLALNAKHEMQAACDTQLACSDAGLQAAARGGSYAAASTGAFIGALVTGGLGAALWFVTSESAHAGRKSGFDRRHMRWEF